MSATTATAPLTADELKAQRLRIRDELLARAVRRFACCVTCVVCVERGGWCVCVCVVVWGEGVGWLVRVERGWACVVWCCGGMEAWGAASTHSPTHPFTHSLDPPQTAHTHPLNPHEYMKHRRRMA